MLVALPGVARVVARPVHATLVVRRASAAAKALTARFGAHAVIENWSKQQRTLTASSMVAKAATRWQLPDMGDSSGGIQLADVQKALDSIAPLQHAASWDNVGLLVGAPQQRVSRALVTIDLTAAVLEEAAEFDADLIIAYHPPIFSGIKRFTAAPLVQRATAAGCAVYSPHTALDAAPGGTNDVLAQQLGLGDAAPLERSAQPQDHKLVVFVPADGLDAVLQAVHRAGAGVIGEYENCAFRSPGTGSFRGSDTSNPTIGTAGQLETVEELRVELVVLPRRLDTVIAALREAHPYEEPAFDVYERVATPLANCAGMGRIGTLPSPMTQQQLAEHVKRTLGLQHVLVVASNQLGVAADDGKQLSKVGLCAGSGGDLVSAALSQGADAFVTGEMRHHDALAAAAKGLTVICTLHSNSERGAMDPYAQMIRSAVPGLDVRVSTRDRDPFMFQ